MNRSDRPAVLVLAFFAVALLSFIAGAYWVWDGGWWTLSLRFLP